MNEMDFKNLMFYIGEYTKNVGRVAARPVLLPIDLISARRFPIIGWLDEVMSLSVAYSKVQSHVAREMDRKADERLGKWLPEYTNYEMVE